MNAKNKIKLCFELPIQIKIVLCRKEILKRAVFLNHDCSTIGHPWFRGVDGDRLGGAQVEVEPQKQNHLLYVILQHPDSTAFFPTLLVGSQQRIETWCLSSLAMKTRPPIIRLGSYLGAQFSWGLGPPMGMLALLKVCCSPWSWLHTPQPSTHSCIEQILTKCQIYAKHCWRASKKSKLCPSTNGGRQPINEWGSDVQPPWAVGCQVSSARSRLVFPLPQTATATNGNTENVEIHSWGRVGESF